LGIATVEPAYGITAASLVILGHARTRPNDALLPVDAGPAQATAKVVPAIPAVALGNADVRPRIPRGHSLISLDDVAAGIRKYHHVGVQTDVACSVGHVGLIGRITKVDIKADIPKHVGNFPSVDVPDYVPNRVTDLDAIVLFNVRVPA
jgi:hypothetical protein